MWRSLLAVILVPSLMAAQAPPEVRPAVSDQTAKPVPNGRVRTPASAESSYTAYTRHTAVRRGRDEDLGIELSIIGFVTSQKPAVAGIVPLTIEFEPLEGFTVREVRGPKVSKSNFKFQGERVKVAASPYLQFKIRAAGDADLGPRVLKGKLTFQRVPSDNSAIGPVEQVDVQIPLNVVERNAKVHKADFPYAPMPTWEKVVLIASIPVLIALVIPLFVLCGVTGACPDC